MVCSTKCQSCCVNVHSTSTILVPSSLESHFWSTFSPLCNVPSLQIHITLQLVWAWWWAEYLRRYCVNYPPTALHTTQWGTTYYPPPSALPTDYPLPISTTHQLYPLHPTNIFSAKPHYFLFISTPNSIELYHSNSHSHSNNDIKNYWHYFVSITFIQLWHWLLP